MQKVLNNNPSRLLQAAINKNGQCFHATSQRNKDVNRLFVCDKSTTRGDREYLHKTKIPTYHFQKSLPRLPIPALDKSCQRYLQAQLPLLSQKEHQELQSVVADFQAGEGKKLHEQLVETDKKNKHTNYVSDLWFDMYLKDRRPVLLTHNPFIVLHDNPDPKYNTQLIRASNMLISSVRMMKTLRDGHLEPEVFHLNPAKSDTDTYRNVTRMLPQSISWYGSYLFKAFPLDMSQYKNLFNSTRIPRPVRDELLKSEKSTHVTIMRNGNFYVFDMMDKDGNVIPETEVLAHLDYIRKDPTPAPEFPISVLTSEFRDAWTQARVEILNADPKNAESLGLIDSAIFSMSLDDHHHTDPDEITRTFLHGDGCNRWFDKSLQLLISSQGCASIHFEHAWGDGVAVLRYLREVNQDSTDNPRVHPDTKPAPNADSENRVKRLEFTLTDSIKDAIEKAKKRFDAVTGSLNISHLEYPHLTKSSAKKEKLSPDSLVQLAIQLAHFKVHGKNAGTYESCSTSAFKFGRTETVRSCTTATDAMCQMLYGKGAGSASVEQLLEGLKTCSTVHGQLTKDAALGQGFDRHLFCLKNNAEQAGVSVPMFQHAAYKNINHIILSTSTLSDPNVVIGGFAAVTPDGYGVGYGIDDKRCGFNIVSYAPVNVAEYLDACKTSLDDLVDILNGQKPKHLS